MGAAGGGEQTGETIALIWLSPQEAMKRASVGELYLPPPQWYLLNELATKYPTLDDVERAVEERMVVPFQPHLVSFEAPDHAANALGSRGEGGDDAAKHFVLALPGDAEHPTYDGDGKTARQARYPLRLTLFARRC